MAAIIEQQTPERMHFAIEKKLSLGVSYIDALVDYAKEHDIEIETVAEIVKKSAVITEKVRSEADGKRLLKYDKSSSAIRFFE
jgi:hypothetical protein